MNTVVYNPVTSTLMGLVKGITTVAEAIIAAALILLLAVVIWFGAILNYDVLKEVVTNQGIISEEAFTILTVPQSVIKDMQNTSKALEAVKEENAGLKDTLAQYKRQNQELQADRAALKQALDTTQWRLQNAIVPETSAKEFAMNRIVEPAEEARITASEFVKTQVGVAREYLKQLWK